MSDTVRTYSPTRRPAAVRRRRTSAGCAIPFALLIPVAIVVTLYALWITRDSTDLASHLPKDDRLRVTAIDVLGHREEIAASGIWQALPLDDDLARIPAMLTQDIDMPQWVLNNIIGPQCFISGDAIGDGQNLLFVTKMHRLGVLIERGFRWSGNAEYDRAGGLGLRHILDPNLYYAVRGRVLLVSPSRRALIHALTLEPGEALTPEELDRITVDLANQQVGGVIHFRDDDPYAEHLDYLRFGIRFDPEEAHAKFEAALSDAWTSRVDGLLDGLTPQTLRMPADGMAVISAHLGKPIAEVWKGIGAATNLPAFSAAQWNEWSTLAEGEAPGLAYTLTQLLGSAGPGFQCSWVGVDPFAMIPMPELVLTADLEPDTAAAIEAAFPEPPANVPAYAPYPRIDNGAGMVTYPIFGGPSLHPTAMVNDNSILVATSRTVTERFIEAPPAREPLPLPGNLYLRIRPLECVNALADAGQQFVDIGALKGYTQDTYREAVARWRRDAERIKECSALLSHNNGLIHGEIRILSNSPTNP